MKPLQITLFLIANVIFLSQAGRNIHHLIFGAQPGVLDQLEPEKEAAKSEAHIEVLLADYKTVFEETKALEKGKKHQEVRDLRQEHSDLYDKQDALRLEIKEREAKSREMRDLWIYSGYGLCLIILGGSLFKRGMAWPGFSILVAGFCILEYWASPDLFYGGAVAEYRQLLWSKTVLTFSALAALYVFWRVRGEPNATLHATASAPGS